MTLTSTLRRARAGAACALALLGLGAAHAALPIEHWQQPGGAQVYLVRSPSIPMVDVQIDFDAGGRRDPREQAGLADAAAGMAAKGVRAAGGQAALDENALGQAWADLGASFGADATSDRTSYSLRSLTDPALLEPALQLAARQLAEPAFPAAVWQRERERWIAALREADTRPGTQAGRAFRQALYPTHPYGYEATAQTLARITADDLRAFHARAIQPCRAKVSIVGAVDRAQADHIARTLLGRVPASPGAPACASLPEIAAVPPLAAPVERRIPFQAAQAQVLIGQPGIRRADPDYFARTVGNYILGGGGFVSRLMNEVREKRGLTYGVSSSFSPALQAGPFAITLQTRPDQAGQAVQVVREVLAGFVADGPTDEELQAAKANLIGGFALRLDSNAKLLANVANIAWNGLPLDYLDTWTQQVDKLSTADIRAAFQRHLQPDRMVTVVLGAREGGQP
ncbi:MAG: putative zinc protease [Paracidovorax wautersii]|uniref:Putative zinc protease n=1 Tax=Paracidovorax wautersii TaxID=1177982 RepID=A0A7V8FKL8_9BURK|nr:MAG: putative zinc protease [Paracidovorax wautersii]